LEPAWIGAFKKSFYSYIYFLSFFHPLDKHEYKII